MNRLKLTMISTGFILSGAIGLTYEVVWQRRMSLIFGTTLPATTAVLAAFMGGLALGSFIFGRIADKHASPLRLYGILEIGTGIYCYLTPSIFNLIHGIHIALFRIMGDSVSLQILRFTLALVTICVPCLFMGGTLPVLTRAIALSRDSLRDRLALLYFLNTLGAVIGTLATGFIFIRTFGMTHVTHLAVFGNIALGLGFMALARRDHASSGPVAASNSSPSSPQRHLLPTVYFICGAIGMGAELAWFRTLNLIIGSTVYAFTMLLSAFLLGIASGSFILKQIRSHTSEPMQWVGGLIITNGLMIAVSIAVLSRLPVVVLWLFPMFHESFLAWQFCLFTLGLITVLPATLCMGALFPVICEAYISEMRTVARSVGQLYLWNTLGGIAGTVLTGFLLIPLIGSRFSLITFAGICLIMGCFMLATYQPKHQLALLGIICIALLYLLPSWDRVLFDSGVYLYAPQMRDGFEADRNMLFEEESVHSFVTVSEKAGIRSLRINGKTDGSDGADLYTQILLAQLPLLHAQGASNVLIIGLGTGVTHGSALTYPEVVSECIEIDPAVIRAARFFDHISGQALSNPRGRIIREDARTVLSAATNHYDVVISEPSNPWISGVSNLFTIEHFMACRKALANDGIMCQWIHSYYMSPSTLLSVFHTFSSVFPHCSVWKGSPGDYLILGSMREHEIDLELIWEKGLPRSAMDDLARVGILSAVDLADRHLLNDTQLRRMVAEHRARINSDDHPVVEFDSPQSLFQNTVQANEELLRSYSSR